MKKLVTLFSVIVCIAGIVSCGSDDEEQQPIQENVGVSELEKSYFSVENATYSEEDFPSATTTSGIEGLSVNSQALTGGMNFITVVSETEYKRFYVGVKDVPGYWVCDANVEARTSSDGYHTYSIMVMYSTEYNSDITMLISGEDVNGDITTPYEAEINYVDSESGDLNINMTFSNAKDIDLHLYTPSGEHIYYGNRGGTVETTDGNTISYGLDKDSNAACNIDNLNNENIYIPAELIEAGTYRVVVDMYSNCDRSIATSWSIVARYKGNVITPDTGSNPATGVYPIGAGDGDMSEVMAFTLQGAADGRSIENGKIKANSFKPTPLTESDKIKLENLEFDMEF